MQILINRIKDEYDLVDIYYFRNSTEMPGLFCSYKDTKEVRDKLSGGITVVLARNSKTPTEGICSLAFCSDDDKFVKREGLRLALKRLDNYIHKADDGSWDYNRENYIHLSGLPQNRARLVNTLAKHLDDHPWIVKRGYQVYKGLF